MDRSGIVIALPFVRKRVGSWVVLGMMVVQTGCYDWVAVKPTEVEKLSGSFVTPVGPNTLAVRVVDVEQTDGRMVQLAGDYPVRIGLRNGGRYTLKSPVDIQATGDDVLFRSANEPPFHASREDIVTVEARKKDAAATAVAITVAVLVVVGITTAIAISVEQKGLESPPQY
jgi:hypothetical protein